MPVDFPRLLLAGLLGSLLMSVAGLFPRLAGLPAVDMGQVVAAKIIGVHIERDTRLGTIIHFIVGVGLALIYGFLVRSQLPFDPRVEGAAFGVVVWLAVMALVMPLIDEGFFGYRLGRWLAPVTLGMHLVYGVTLGAVYN